MRVLVTGHNGYIGAVMVDVLARAGHDVVGLDTCFFGDCTFGAARLQASELRADVRGLDTSDLIGFDAVIHLAALSSGPPGNRNLDVTYDINHVASVRLARLARNAGVSRFLFASSCSVYGGAPHDGLLTEEADLKPLTPHANSKMLVERDVAKLATDRFSPIFLRNATAYGVSSPLRTDTVVNGFVGYALTTGDVLVRSDGTPWRPFVHVEDISRAFLAALEAPRHLVHNRAFNVGLTRENYQIRDLAEMIVDAVPGSRITYAPGGRPDPCSYRVNCDELAWTLPSFVPRWTLRDGVRELYEAYRREGLTYDSFAGPGSRYLRLRHLQRLQCCGALDEELRWTMVADAAAIADEGVGMTSDHCGSVE
jgi:nucleoside-diphosphate-sugar epimerase